MSATCCHRHRAGYPASLPCGPLSPEEQRDLLAHARHWAEVGPLYHDLYGALADALVAVLEQLGEAESRAEQAVREAAVRLRDGDGYDLRPAYPGGPEVPAPTDDAMAEVMRAALATLDVASGGAP